MNLRRNKTAQQIIEYLLLFTTIVTVVLVFSLPTGPFRSSVNRILHSSPQVVNEGTNSLCDGYDCGARCGNGICETMSGETCSSCPQDCGLCPACPNGTCEATETCATCPADCGACPAALCPNGIREGAEECDGFDLGGKVCPDGVTHKVKCTSGCVFDYSDCPPLCENGTINSGEECDGVNLGGNNCTTLGKGYTGGELSCYPQGDPQQCQFNESNCTRCGNEIIDTDEACDGGKFPEGKGSCDDIGMTMGSWSCAADCSAIIQLCCENWNPGACGGACGSLTCGPAERCETRNCPDGAPGPTARCVNDPGNCLFCGGDSIAHAVLCPGDGNGLSVPTNYSLASGCVGAVCQSPPACVAGSCCSGGGCLVSACTETEKCEMYCAPGYVSRGGTCTKCGNNICDSGAPDFENVSTCPQDCTGCGPLTIHAGGCVFVGMLICGSCGDYTIPFGNEGETITLTCGGAPLMCAGGQLSAQCVGGTWVNIDDRCHN